MVMEGDAIPSGLVRLNIGCGKDVKAGYRNWDNLVVGEGVENVDLRGPWPVEDESVDEIHASHVIEHFDAMERVHVVNEMWRVLRPGGFATVITPHAFSGRAYGDPTHKWPPVHEFWFYYLSKEWRERETPALVEVYRCDFAVTWGYMLSDSIAGRNDEFRQFAATFYRDVVMDIHATMRKELKGRQR